ncbi:aldo/keto reductase [Haliovirga abyssi]|uniref:Oxidoreductase ion channel protein IolS n=1 Tax=Haliovirga abyssi TaxID=2996794 RepID=A0AAU9DA44_9FUSO|nr:aldo/keto reductase [Haliovirga abyssi]BDU51513.1 oxidoreductase ion channel protein IolS [Haliovirga abyssi]
MLYKKLGKSDMNVSVLGYGAWALGEDGWGGINLDEAYKTINLAIKSGINFFDTAPIYGMGKSEERIGELLKEIRKDIYIATKCGLLWNENKEVRIDNSRDAIMYDIEKSLKRLKTDYIDLYQIHWPDNKTPLKESFTALNELKEQNIIRNIGVCNFSLEQLKEGLEYSEIVSLQNQYNLLQNSIEEKIMPFCEKNKISIIPYSPLAQGMLSGKIDENYQLKPGDIREHNPLFNNKDNFEKAIKKIKELPKPLSHTAIQYLIDKSSVGTVIFSVTKRNHLEENLKALKKYM